MIFGMRIHQHLIEPILKPDFEISRFWTVLDSFGKFWTVLGSEKSSLLGCSIFIFEVIRGEADNGDNTVR